MGWAAGAVAVAGHVLEYVRVGPPPAEAPTLVMLHEGLGSVGLWRDWPETLAKATGMGVLAYSRAGYGRSSPVDLPRPLDYMTREAVEVLGPLLDELGVHSAVLLGHSDGATIAGIYDGSVSDMRVRGMILIAPHFYHEPMGLDAIREARAAFDGGKLREKLAKYHADVDVAFRGWADAWLDPANADWNVAEVIDYLRTPTLCIQGDLDPYGTMAQIDEVADRSYAPVDDLRLTGIGHAPHIEAQEEVLECITEFCARLARIESEVVAL